MSEKHDSDEPVIVERRREHNQAVIVMIQGVQKSLEALDAKVTAQKDETMRAIESVVKSAFPEGDPDGHRRHHEAVIAAAERRADFWQTMSKELGKWGLIGFAGWVAYNLWQAFLRGPH